MKFLYLMVCLAFCQPVFSGSGPQTYTLDIIPFALGFENNSGEQIIKIYIRSIGNVRFLSQKTKFKIGSNYFESALRNYKTGKIADNDNKLTLGEFGYYEVNYKGNLLDHCGVYDVEIDLENSFERGPGVKENNRRDMTAFEMGNTHDCDNLPLRMRKPQGQGIEL